MKVTEMHRKDFDNVPAPQFDYISEPFYSLVIISTNKIHSSGYRIMHFVAVDKTGEPLFKISGGSDVVDIDGIGGLGDLSNLEVFQTFVLLKDGRSIACLVDIFGYSAMA